jgi:hypothetical protein
MVSFSAQATSVVVLSNKIKPQLQNKINQDLAILDAFPFRQTIDLKTSRVLGIPNSTNEVFGAWLNKRVKYIIEENLVTKKTVSVEQENVDYPTPLTKLYSQTDLNKQATASVVMMGNIGSQYYIEGKNQHKLFALKVSQQSPKKPILVPIDSPRAGVLQIGAALFAPQLAINRIDDKALANSILRLSFYFHEARHSDGNGTSLGFAHSICPQGHDYENEFACDESLNGAYSVGAAIAREMVMACDTGCSERDKEMLKIFILDNYNRLQVKTHLNTPAKYWDPTPEKL